MELVVSQVLLLARLPAILGLSLAKGLVLRSALDADVVVERLVSMPIKILAVVVELPVLRRGNTHEIGDVVIKWVAIFVMYVIALWNRSVIMLPNGNVKCNLVSVPVFPSAPKVSPSMLLLGIEVSVVLPPVEHDGFRPWVAHIHSAANWF